MINFETEAVEGTTNPSWVSPKNPTGRVFNIGSYDKSQQMLALEFEVLNQVGVFK